MANAKKGAPLEELIRAYFSKQGYLAIRGVPVRYEGEDVTDIDVWVYGRQAASGRTRAIVDAKDKRSPKALERVLWTKGLQSIVGADRAIVVTTDESPRVARFARENRVSVITKSFLDRIRKSDIAREDRLSWEELEERLRQNPNQKQDGDWIRKLGDAKALIGMQPSFANFNGLMTIALFFAERIETRPLFREQAVRCLYISLALAAAALDGAVERVVLDDESVRQRSIFDGVAFGDTGDGRTQRNITNVLNLVGESLENGRVIAAEVKRRLDERIAGLRADVIAEFFGKEANFQMLFPVARELEAAAFRPAGADLNGLSIEARSVVGVFLDFLRIRRSLVFAAVPEVKAAPSADGDDVVVKPKPAVRLI